MELIRDAVSLAVFWPLISLMMDFGIHSVKAWMRFHPFLAYLS
jgi:hypothetical protein